MSYGTPVFRLKRQAEVEATNETEEVTDRPMTPSK